MGSTMYIKIRDTNLNTYYHETSAAWCDNEQIWIYSQSHKLTFIGKSFILN